MLTVSGTWEVGLEGSCRAWHGVAVVSQLKKKNYSPRGKSKPRGWGGGGIFQACEKYVAITSANLYADNFGFRTAQIPRYWPRCQTAGSLGIIISHILRLAGLLRCPATRPMHMLNTSETEANILPRIFSFVHMYSWDFFYPLRAGSLIMIMRFHRTQIADLVSD